MTFLDRIKETSTSTGTSTFTLAGAVVGYKTFTNGTYKYCIVNSTETEWEVGEGTVASGVLTRTTIEASSNAGSAVNFSAGTKYVFNTVSAAYVNSLVPYTGASSNVNLGEFGLTAGQLTLDTSPTGTAVVGTTQWNDTIGSSQTLLKGGNVLLKNGVDLVARVVNKVSPATTLTKAAYKAVRVSGAQGQRLAIAYAQANNDNNSADTIGLVCETIAANQEGFIITVGQLLDVNTTGSLQGETWSDGDVLYLSPTTAGNLTNIKPTGATGHIVIIGYVEYAHQNNGKIYVKIMNGWELDELHNVYISSVANNQVLTYESSTDLWKNKSIATILGYTPQAAITLTTTGTSGASTFVSNTLNIPQYQGALTLTTTGTSGAATLVGNTLNIPQYSGGGGISGSGTAGQVTYWSGTSAVTGSSNLFWDNTNARLGIGTSSPGNTLHLSSFNTSNSQFRISSLEFQSYSVNNSWIGDNVYYNGSNFVRRSTGYAGMFYFAGKEGQFRFASTAAAGTNITDGITNSGLTSLKVCLSGTVAIGGDISTVFDTFTGSKMLVFGSTGNVLIQNGGTFTDAGYRLDINGTGATAGALRVTGGNVQFGSSTGLNWDNTNARLGIGTNAPGFPMHISASDNNFIQQLLIENTNTGANAIAYFTLKVAGLSGGGVAFYGSNYTNATQRNSLIFYTEPNQKLGFIANANSTGTNQNIYFATKLNNTNFTIFSTGNALIQNSGTHSDNNYRLEVEGTGATNGALRILSGKSVFAACTTSYASLNIPSGTAPTSPANGDIWFDGTNIYLRVGGSTKTFTLI